MSWPHLELKTSSQLNISTGHGRGLEWGGGRNGGGGDALAELPAAGLPTLARHTFYGAYVR